MLNFLQKKRNGELETVPTHKVIQEYIERNGMDYRYEDAPSPREELRDRTCDNVILGRNAGFATQKEGIEFLLYTFFLYTPQKTGLPEGKPAKTYSFIVLLQPLRKFWYGDNSG